jgi:hypothetical protein
MTVSATSVRFDEHTMWVDLTEGERSAFPLLGFRGCCARALPIANSKRSPDERSDIRDLCVTERPVRGVTSLARATNLRCRLQDRHLIGLRHDKRDDRIDGVINELRILL